MRNIAYAAFSAVLFISFAGVALAADPSVPQPFGFYCDDYLTPFSDGGYYTPTDGGSCTYNLPAVAHPTTVVSIFKGIPGNALPIKRDSLASGSTYVFTSSPNFFGAVGPLTQDDDFFAVAYGIDSNAQFFDADNFFTSGTGVTPDSYSIVKWKWGVAPPPTTAPLTVTADNKSMVAGSVVPALTATLSGFVNGDTASSSDVTGSASCSTTTTSASSAGSYPITCTLGTLASAAHYIFTTFVAGTLTVTAPPPPPPPPTPNCLLELNGTAKGAVTLAGSAAIRITGCKAQVNSNATNAVDISGSATITSLGNCVVGTVKKSGSASLSPAATPCSAKADPFASYPKPVVPSTCTYTNYTTSGAKTVTLSPGTYCGGIVFNGSSNITFAPGLYIIKDGPLQTNGSTQLSGNGVSFFLTGKNAGLSFNGSTNAMLTAASGGALPGFLFFLDPASTNAAASSVFSGSTNFNFTGVVYLPHQAVSLAGSSTSPGAPHFMAWVADTFSLSGSSSLTIDATHPSVPVPSGL